MSTGLNLAIVIPAYNAGETLAGVLGEMLQLSLPVLVVDDGSRDGTGTVAGSHPVERVLTHPEMTLPDGSKVTRSERMMRRKATGGIVTSLDVYALSEDYELVEGDWTFQIWYEDKKLVEKTFTVYQPGSDDSSSNTVQTPSTGNDAKS